MRHRGHSGAGCRQPRGSPGDIVNPYGASTELFRENSVVPGGKIGIPRSPPVKGTLLTVPAAVTPGMLRTASIIAFFFSSGTSPSTSLTVHVGHHCALRLESQRRVQHAHHTSHRDE